MVTMTKSGERSISGRKAIRRSSRGEASRCSLGGTGDDGGVGGRQQPPPCRPRAAPVPPPCRPRAAPVPPRRPSRAATGIPDHPRPQTPRYGHPRGRILGARGPFRS